MLAALSMQVTQYRFTLELADNVVSELRALKPPVSPETSAATPDTLTHFACKQQDYSEERSRQMIWGAAALRQSIILAYAFKKTVLLISKHVHTTPSIGRQVSTCGVRRSKKIIARHFPDLDLIRDALAHPMELTLDDDGFEAHRTKSDAEGRSVAQSEMVELTGTGLSVSVTFKHRQLLASVSAEQLAGLSEATLCVWRDFMPIAETMPAEVFASRMTQPL